MTDLKPHTPEWFEALDRQNPQQAAMTRKAIAVAGCEDGCSVCGDDPATDYKLVDPLPAPGTVSTLRLCDDCRSIRKAMQGETYQPL